MKEITINQIKDVHQCKYSFMGYKYAKDKINPEDYKTVAYFDVEDKDNNKILNWLWNVGNDGTLQKDYEMRSISMSDVITIDGTAYYVDTFGFKEVE